MYRISIVSPAVNQSTLAPVLIFSVFISYFLSSIFPLPQSAFDLRLSSLFLYFKDRKGTRLFATALNTEDRLDLLENDQLEGGSGGETSPDGNETSVETGGTVLGDDLE